MARYAELHCLSNFSFLRGASHPEELVRRAAELGYHALAITDRNSLAGVVRAHIAANKIVEEGGPPLELLIGAEITPVDAPPVVLLAQNRAGYGHLARLITRGRLRTPKGECEISFADIADLHQDLLAIVLPDQRHDPTLGLREAPAAQLAWYRALFADRAYLAAELAYDLPDAERLARLAALSRQSGLPLVACNNVHYHVPERRYLQDVLTCIRARCTLAEAGRRLFPNAERHLRPKPEIARRYAACPELLARTVEISERCAFSLDELRYEYPHELVPEGLTPIEFLSRLTWRGAVDRFGQVAMPDAASSDAGWAPSTNLRPGDEGLDSEELSGPERKMAGGAHPTSAAAGGVQLVANGDGPAYESRRVGMPPNTAGGYLDAVLPREIASLPEPVREQVTRELDLIAELKYEHYFLTVWDLVRFARNRGILCQGRGSAANSIVCYCLGVTAVDPARVDLLFERFISRERNEPPDIDVDFEHERREEVFQYIYEKYGRERAAITAEVISYRPRSAIRDVGKTLGFSLDRLDSLSKSIDWFDRRNVKPAALRHAGFDPRSREVRMLVRLVRQLLGFPRHLSQHVGGFVITESPLCEIVPLENGAMPDRTFIEWDKDDIDALGILKVDCLALGMLTAINDALRDVFALECRLWRMLKGRDGGTQGRRDAGTKGRGDGGTEGRGDGGAEGQRALPWRHWADAWIRSGCEQESDFSRSDCVAQGDRADKAGLSHHAATPRNRALRSPNTNETSGGVSGKQYRGGKRSRASTGVSEISDNCAGFISGIGNSAHNCAGTANAQKCRSSHGTFAGNGSHPPGADTQPPKTPDLSSSLTPFSHPCAPASLRPFVPPSLPRYVPSSLFPHDLLEIPPEDPLVYDMICKADTLGVFQIESRAQMSMLPRLKPRSFYDLVIEVAIVRPGPIQGGMVHPYLRRRDGLEKVEYPSAEVRDVLRKTLGVPLFQEQVMKLAVVAAGFTPGEADQLRRAMAAWRRSGSIHKFQDKLAGGLKANGYSEEFADRIFKQIEGFGEYGFPESHAASFALLVYASCWLKRYQPAIFCAAMLNSQPLGFYSPGQLIRDAQAHGVPILPVDVNRSAWDCTLEMPGGGPINGPYAASDDEETGDELQKTNDLPPPLIPTEACNIYSAAPEQWGRFGPAVRLGMRLVRGLSEERVNGIVAQRRENAQIDSIQRLSRRSDVRRDTLVRLAAADAFRSLGYHRRQAFWQILALDHDHLPLFADLELDEPPLTLPEMSVEERVLEDYQSGGFSLDAHPLQLIRSDLDGLKITPAKRVRDLPNKRWARVAGLVTVRQRPGTAKGTVFMTLEDETGLVNLVIRPKVWERYWRTARNKVALIAEGPIERQGEVVHVMARRFHDLAAKLGALTHHSRDFH